MLRKVFSLTITLFAVLGAFAQPKDNAGIITLAKSYRTFMFRVEATKDDISDLKKSMPTDLAQATDFIVQTISTNNKLLSVNYLSRPSDTLLKTLYMLDAVYNNLDEENTIDNNVLLDSLREKQIPAYEMLSNYYSMLFTSVGNKNQPFNLSKTNLTVSQYNFKDDTEKGILVLQALHFCNTQVWGYMNIPKPANTKKALENIKKFPAINGKPYYQYTDFYFPDFDMLISKDDGVSSYKKYYINKLYETLIYHLVCLNKEGVKDNEKHDLLLGSVLRSSNLYKYTKYKSTLEEIFQKQ